MGPSLSRYAGEGLGLLYESKASLQIGDDVFGITSLLNVLVQGRETPFNLVFLSSCQRDKRFLVLHLLRVRGCLSC
jgi:hypothetical protein